MFSKKSELNARLTWSAMTQAREQPSLISPLVRPRHPGALWHEHRKQL